MFLFHASEHNSNIHHKCLGETFRYSYSFYIGLNCFPFPLVNTHIPDFLQRLYSREFQNRISHLKLQIWSARINIMQKYCMCGRIFWTWKLYICYGILYNWIMFWSTFSSSAYTILRFKPMISSTQGLYSTKWRIQKFCECYSICGHRIRMENYLHQRRNSLHVWNKWLGIRFVGVWLSWILEWQFIMQ